MFEAFLFDHEGRYCMGGLYTHEAQATKACEALVADGFASSYAVFFRAHFSI